MSEFKGFKKSDGTLIPCRDDSKQTTLTTQQLAAVNSGITSEKVAKIATIDERTANVSQLALDVEQIKAVSITYSELKALRDAGNLVPGRQYRITDYHCTTTQADTMSADHQFDIIVVADTNSVLNENARACLHAGDTYFSSNGCKLESWQLKYCIDNDDTRFAWADTTNGKGVILFMKDEWGNECPYDFKNIMFKRWYDENEEYHVHEEIEDVEPHYCHTFCMWDFFTDSSHDVTVEQGKYISDEGIYYYNYGNVIKPYINSYSNEDAEFKERKYLNNICFVSDTNYCCCEEDYSYCEYYGCYSNTFGNDCYSNTFGNDCNSNTFGNDCSSNTFGNYCYSNTFGNTCYYNTFGDDCYSNTFGNYCSYNTFGDDCYSNTFGNYCKYNTFGNYCYSNTFGNTCYYNTFGTSSSVKNYVKNITIENGVSYTYINCTSTTSSSAYFQNVHVNSGVCGESYASRVILTVSSANNKFLTTFGYNSSGVLTRKCLMDANS